MIAATLMVALPGETAGRGDWDWGEGSLRSVGGEAIFKLRQKR